MEPRILCSKLLDWLHQKVCNMVIFLQSLDLDLTLLQQAYLPNLDHMSKLQSFLARYPCVESLQSGPL